MKKDYEQLFSHLDAPVPRDLSERILSRIAARERRILAVKFAFFGGAFLASVVSMAYGFVSLNSQLAQSGFPQFFSLLFSDFSVAVANFPDFALSITESFPVFSAAILTGGIALTVWSIAGLHDEVMAFK